MIIKNEADFQKLKKSGIQIQEIEKYSSLQEMHEELADHLYDVREDVYSDYFDEDES
jgi:hypothetical protein